MQTNMAKAISITSKLGYIR